MKPASPVIPSPQMKETVLDPFSTRTFEPHVHGFAQVFTPTALLRPVSVGRRRPRPTATPFAVGRRRPKTSATPFTVGRAVRAQPRTLLPWDGAVRRHPRPLLPWENAVRALPRPLLPRENAVRGHLHLQKDPHPFLRWAFIPHGNRSPPDLTRCNRKHDHCRRF